VTAAAWLAVPQQSDRVGMVVAVSEHEEPSSDVTVSCAVWQADARITAVQASERRHTRPGVL